MSLRTILTLVSCALISSCAAPPAATPAPPAATAPAAADPAKAAAASAAEQAAAQKQKLDARRKQQKDLRQKQRELAHAKVEQQVEALDRRHRTMSVDAALERTGVDLEAARAELNAFLQDEKPRELEARRISLDGTVYRAEHSKDELAELTAMYEADEFARTTKELVLKRGRRDLELSDRRLAVERREFAHFEQFELPKRERELRHKVADAELARRKAELDVEKARFELDLADQKRTERLADLDEEIRELQEELAKESP
jgi:hypothetical protein